MSDTLLPCPFCHGQDIEIHRSSVGTWWWCKCNSCQGDGPVGIHGEAEAIAAWNRRPSPWLDISSAPKDGTHIIILCPGGRVATASYEKQSFIGDGWFVLVPCNGGFGMGSDTFLRWDDDQPTHWMPIPGPLDK